MSTTCATSLSLPALNSKALSFHNKPTISFSLPASKPLSLTRLVDSFPLSSRCTRNVAFAAEYGQDEEFSSFGGGKEDRQVSPYLKVFVGNIPFSVDSSQLAELFQDAGTVEMVEVIYDNVTGRSRGFGFVTMSSAEEAEAVARQFDGYEFEGRALRVNAGPPPERDSSRPPRGSSFGGRSNEPVISGSRCYVGNLSWGVDNSALESLFSEQGDVKEAMVVYDRETGRSRGFGFVTYGSSAEANGAVDALDGVELDGRSIRVSIAEARPPRREF